MGKRKSQSIGPESSDNVPEATQEFDVAGPLTLEEAKAVGDVPEDFKVNQSTGGAGGILKHPAPAEEDGIVPSSTEAEASGERKSVTFAEQSPETIESEKPSRRKSLLEILHLKKKKDTEPIAETQGETGSLTQDEGATSPTNSKAESTEGATEGEDSSKPKKRKSVLSSLFHRKKEDMGADKSETPDDAAQAIDTAAAQAEEVKQTETPGPPTETQETEATGVAPTEQVEASTSDVTATGEAQNEAPATNQASEGSSCEKKSFFGRLFSKRSSRGSDGSDNGTTAIVAGAAATEGEGQEMVEEEATNSAPAQTSEELSPPAKKKKPFWASTYPEPSPDAAVMKEGDVRKKGYIFQSFRPRSMRLMSDGTLQYTRKKDEWEDAKGLRLSHDMDLEMQENAGKGLYILKLNVPGCKSCVFGFEHIEDRDSWRSAFEEIRTKLQAGIPDDGNQHVVKSGSLENDDPQTSSNGGEKASD